MRKCWMIGVCVVLLLAMLPWSSVLADGVNTLTVAQLQQKYPNGTYWNHTKGGNEDYTRTPCNHHTGNCTYDGACGCNTYRNRSMQCMGFAYQLAALAYDCEPSNEWTANYNKSALDKLKAGDIVRYRWNGHSIFVTAVNGDTVTYADCNWDHQCGIRWGCTISKATLKASFTYVKSAPFTLPEEPAAPTVEVTYHAGGGTIANQVVGYTYRVLSTNGINMRKDAGTDQAKVSALPHNTVFTVEEGDTKDANGYTWGKTTYDGKTGWVVISDFVEKIGEQYSGEWLVADGIVCRTDGTPLIHTLTYGEAVTSLADTATLGLVKEGYRFVGWCTTADGKGVVWEAGMKPDELCPDQATTLTLYALWESEKPEQPPIVSSDSTLRGDANGDQKLNNKDLGLLQQWLNYWDVAVDQMADVNKDGKINNKDLGMLQQLLNE